MDREPKRRLPSSDSKSSGVPLAIDGQPLRLQIRVFSQFVERARGLLGSAAVRHCDGVRLEPCRAVHTMGMTRSIDVVFVDAGGRVLRVAPSMRPWRVAAHSGAQAVYELPDGAAARCGIVVGRTLSLWQNGRAE